MGSNRIKVFEHLSLLEKALSFPVFPWRWLLTHQRATLFCSASLVSESRHFLTILECMSIVLRTHILTWYDFLIIYSLSCSNVHRKWVLAILGDFHLLPFLESVSFASFTVRDEYYHVMEQITFWSKSRAFCCYCWLQNISFLATDTVLTFLCFGDARNSLLYCFKPCCLRNPSERQSHFELHSKSINQFKYNWTDQTTISIHIYYSSMDLIEELHYKLL